MYTLPVKKWVHTAHLDSGHDMGLWMRQVTHDERFWPIIVALAVMGLFVGIIIWAIIYGESNPNIEPMPTFPLFS